MAGASTLEHEPDRQLSTSTRICKIALLSGLLSWRPPKSGSRVVLHDALFGGVRPAQPRGPELSEDADTACVGVFPLSSRFSPCLRPGGLWASMRHPVSQGKGAFQVDTETKSSRFGSNSLCELLPIFSSSWYKRSSLSRGYRKLTRRIYTVPSPSWHAHRALDRRMVGLPSFPRSLCQIKSVWRLLPQCFNIFRADIFFRCGCERCYRCIQFCGNWYH